MSELRRALEEIEAEIMGLLGERTGGGLVNTVGGPPPHGGLVTRRWLVILLALVAASTGWPGSTGTRITHACSCFEPTEQQAFHTFDLVFAGTVANIGSNMPDRSEVTPGHDVTLRNWWSVDVDVEHVWKGEVGRSITLANTYGAACGFEDYEIGGRYLLFVSFVSPEEDVVPFASMCSGSRRLEVDDNGIPITELGEPRTPLTAVPTEPTQVAIVETRAPDVDAAAEPVAVESVAAEPVVVEPVNAESGDDDASTDEAWGGWALALLAVGLGVVFVVIQRSRRHGTTKGGVAE